MDGGLEIVDALLGGGDGVRVNGGRVLNFTLQRADQELTQIWRVSASTFSAPSISAKANWRFEVTIRVVSLSVSVSRLTSSAMV